MADLRFVAATADVALVAATVKTVLQVQAPASHRVRILGWSVSFDGQLVTAEPVTVNLIRQAGAGTMTAYTSTDITTLNMVSEAVQSTVRHTATVEPSASSGQATLDTALVHPQSGYEVKFPIGQEPIIPGAGYVGLVITAPQSVNVRAKMICEE